MSPLMQVTESFRRCLESPDFFACFYELLLSRSPDLKPVFKSVDVEAQEVVMRKGVTAMIMHAAGVRAATASLEQIGKSSSKDKLGIQPGQVTVWTDTLIETIRAFDPRFNADLQNAWKKVLDQGMEKMLPENPVSTLLS